MYNDKRFANRYFNIMPLLDLGNTIAFIFSRRSLFHLVDFRLAFQL